MFFTAKMFKDVIRDDQAETIAKLCNDIIDKNGLVLYGNAYEDDKLNNFTSTRERADTHLGILIGLSEMGIFEYDGSTLKKEKPTEQELFELSQEQNKVLLRENNMLRNKNGID